MSVVGAATGTAFRGLAAFDEAAAETFFGREEEAARLAQLTLVETTRLVSLAGESGVGKTSLLRAALIPSIQKRGGQAIYLGAYDDLDAEVLHATGRRRPPTTWRAWPTRGAAAPYWCSTTSSRCWPPTRAGRRRSRS